VSRRRVILALAASAAFATVPVAAASAEAPAGARTVTAIGTASVPVRRPARLSDATIRRAVGVAEAQVGPAAVVNARREATRLASALGVTLGALQSVAEQPASPFIPYYGVGQGTFGPGRYCGTTRRRVYRQTADHRRVPTGRIVSHHTCRIPPAITMSVSATYLVS
jgi:hypothetical protein